ncbi:MAG: AAA family ATPase [Oscillospiraceae bacterium]
MCGNARKGQNAKTIAIHNHKGSVGKATTVINLAASLRSYFQMGELRQKTSPHQW